MDLVRLLNDYSVPHDVQARGWVQMKCCFCPDQGMHLGIAITTLGVSCWKCGKHRLVDTLARLLRVRSQDASVLIEEYGGRKQPTSRSDNALVRIGTKKPFLFPSNCSDLLKQHRTYLRNRFFDPDRLVRDWRIMATGPFSNLDSLDYKWRIVIPVFWGERIVSFQARDVCKEEAQRVRYLACPKEREIKPYKSIVYGHEEEWRRNPDEWFVCVEGVTDVWRLGFRAFATFGIQVTDEQVLCISKTFRKVVIAFDDEIQAQIQARDLSNKLQLRGLSVVVTTVPGKDPGSMTAEDARAWMDRIRNPETRRRAL